MQKNQFGEIVNQKKVLVKIEGVSTLGELLSSLQIKNHLNLSNPEAFKLDVIIDGYSLDSDELVQDFANLEEDLPVFFYPVFEHLQIEEGSLGKRQFYQQNRASITEGNPGKLKYSNCIFLGGPEGVTDLNKIHEIYHSLKKLKDPILKQIPLFQEDQQAPPKKSLTSDYTVEPPQILNSNISTLESCKKPVPEKMDVEKQSSDLSSDSDSSSSSSSSSNQAKPQTVKTIPVVESQLAQKRFIPKFQIHQTKQSALNSTQKKIQSKQVSNFDEKQNTNPNTLPNQTNFVLSKQKEEIQTKPGTLTKVEKDLS